MGKHLTALVATVAFSFVGSAFAKDRTGDFSVRSQRPGPKAHVAFVSPTDNRESPSGIAAAQAVPRASVNGSKLLAATLITYLSCRRLVPLKFGRTILTIHVGPRLHAPCVAVDNQSNILAALQEAAGLPPETTEGRPEHLDRLHEAAGRSFSIRSRTCGFRQRSAKPFRELVLRQPHRFPQRVV